MLESFGLAAGAVCVSSGMFLIHDSMSATTDSSQFKLLAGAVLFAIGLVAMWPIARNRLEDLRIFRKYRHKPRLSH